MPKTLMKTGLQVADFIDEERFLSYFGLCFSCFLFLLTQTLSFSKVQH